MIFSDNYYGITNLHHCGDRGFVSGCLGQPTELAGHQEAGAFGLLDMCDVTTAENRRLRNRETADWSRG